MSDSELQTKEKSLREFLARLGEGVVAFSGGCDSTLLLAIVAEEFSRAVAITARAPIFPAEELVRAREIAAGLDVEHVMVDIDPFAIPAFRRNDPRRCYHCKIRVMGEIRRVAESHGIEHVMEASQASDLADYRPGMEAVKELGIISPLLEAGLTGDDVRALSEQMDLPTANLPSMACFASRVPYGTEITPEIIERVAAAEEVVRNLGIKQLRVRHHGEIARIEITGQDFPRIMEENTRMSVIQSLQELGYTYVTLDLSGYRSGSMNDVLTGDETSGENH